MNNFGNGGMSTWVKILLGVVAAVALIFVAATMFFYFQYQNLKKNPNAEKESETKSLVEQVKKFYDLPTDETPTVATVSDKSKVVDQPFFAKAENGDKILIYRKNKLAILFRPSDNKLINVGPIDLDAVSGASSASTTPAAAAVAKVGLYNASSTTGITTEPEKKLTSSAYAGTIAIAEKKSATSKTLGKIVVVDISGKNSDIASKIASTLGGSVGDLPAGETKPTVDIAVFIGK